ncbi:Light-independent protochlorophyllide reductase subunit B [anaerobic digester metagenome]
MKLYRYFPLPSDRMGALWALCGIKEACILEFGPSGNTSYATSGFLNLNAKVHANIFTTHLTENDITFGNTDRIRAALIEIDKVHSPKEIFILPSSLAAVSGTDVFGICAEIEELINAKLIVVDKGGFQGDHTFGIRKTTTLLCREIVEETSYKNGKYNIIGSQADCFNYSADVEEIKRIMLKLFGLECHAVFSSDCTIDEIRTASAAMFNLVIRSEGIDGAIVLKEKYDQKFVCINPYGMCKTLEFIENIKTLIGIIPDEKKFAEEVSECNAAISRIKDVISFKDINAVICGNHDLILGIKSFFHEMGINSVCSMVNHLVKGDNYFRDGLGDVLINPDEDKIEQMLTRIKPELIWGDGTTLQISRNLGFNNSFQIANPNNGVIKIFHYAPFIGFHGTIYLCEVLCNMLLSQMHS